MPTYFFHVTYKERFHDDQGVDLPDRATAWKQATAAAGRAIAELDGDAEPGRDWRLDVTNQRQQVLFSLKFRASAFDP